MLSLLSPSVDEDGTTNGNGVSGRKRKKSAKGWDGEAIVVASDSLGSVDDQDGKPHITFCY